MSPLFLWHIFVNVMAEKLFSKFCHVLIRFQEVKKFQTSEFTVSEVIAANV